MGLIKNVKSFFDKYERYLTGGALITGFTVDSLTLTRIDLWFDNLILLAYIILVGGTILIINSARKTLWFQRWLPYVMQYAFGGLFSGFFIFYTRSASLSGSWPFLVVLLFLLIGNEFFKGKYERLTFNIGVFYVAVFSYFIFLVPVLLGRMGAWIFILSGILSLIFISLVIWLIFFFTRGRLRGNKKKLKLLVGSIFIVFNILYFTNIIPPIPLSLKDAGVYYKIEQNPAGGYVVYREDLPWYKFYKRDTINHVAGTPIYSFSAVFAPSKLSSTIIHEWSYYNEEKNEWEVASRIPFSISGGRDGGYRGYTLKTNITLGKWRVDVVTNRGQLIGRTKFEVVQADQIPPLEPVLK